MRRAVTTSSLLGLAALGVLAGCPDRTISEVNPEQGRVEYKDIPVNPERDVDILFVIDDSRSMADKQANLAANFREFINVLNTIEGGLPDVHIGVVSSNMGTKPIEGPPGPDPGGCAGSGDDGRLLVSGGAPVNGPFISDIAGTVVGQRIRNYTGDLADVFAQMAVVGDQGCGFEQHLHSMQRALQNTAANPGFLRPDAYLAVIFIADEDDCSVGSSALLTGGDGSLGTLQSFRCTRFGVTCEVNGATPQAMNQVGVKDQCSPNESSQYMAKVGDFVTYLKGLKPDDPSKVIVAGIMGTIEPFAVEMRPPPGSSTPEPALAHSCRYDGMEGEEVADPPIRLKHFLDQFPNRNTFTTICQPDLTGGLQQIAELLKTALGDPCINGKLADVDKETPGPQYDCSVSDVSNYLKPNQEETIVPRCDDASSVKPCWKIESDPVQCKPPDSGLILKIDRGNTTPPDGTHMIAYCVTEP